LLPRILILINLLLYAASYGQGSQQRVLDSLDLLPQLDSLTHQFATNKIFLDEYRLVTLAALSHYPELSNTRIVFKRSKIKTTLNARPTAISLLFRSKEKRKYVIRINSQLKDSVIYFHHIPFNAKVGVLGHELAHINDYNTRNFWRVLKRLFAYSGKKSKAAFEKEIDHTTIEKGLGWQLYDWSDYVLNKSDARVKYKKFKQETYLTPEEIKNRIENTIK